MPASPQEPSNTTPSIGIIGGGIAGATIALKLSAQGLAVNLIEQGPSLVNGPPICHLHAGGNLYREIDEQQCITLLRQSIDTLKLYHDSADYRPTVIAIPKRDAGEVSQLLPRLTRLQQEYAALVTQSPDNKVLGEPQDYFSLFSQADVERIAQMSAVKSPKTKEQWLIPVAKSLDLSQLKFPLIMVEEYGLSVFRLAATASLALASFANCQVSTETKVSNIIRRNNTWQVCTITKDGDIASHQFDYLINACGYQSGHIDDLIGEHSERLVEFKAAYVTRWPLDNMVWPEVIFYGERGTPNGMAQLTPYPGGYFQVHGMTQDITLFEQGLVTNTPASAQPQLDPRFLKKLTKAWPPAIIKQRTHRAIDFISHFIPSFSSATVGGKPLFGAQQIPGQDPDLRAADVCFSQDNYARCEIVKASSAIDAATAIIKQLVKQGLLSSDQIDIVSTVISSDDIEKLAIKLAKQRNYPIELASRVTAR